MKIRQTLVREDAGMVAEAMLGLIPERWDSGVVLVIRLLDGRIMLASTTTRMMNKVVLDSGDPDNKEVLAKQVAHMLEANTPLLLEVRPARPLFWQMVPRLFDFVEQEALTPVESSPRALDLVRGLPDELGHDAMVFLRHLLNHRDQVAVAEQLVEVFATFGESAARKLLEEKVAMEALRLKERDTDRPPPILAELRHDIRRPA